MVAEFAGLGLDDEAIDRPHEGGQGFAAAGGRAKQDVMAGRTRGGGDYRPSELLGARGGVEAAPEPLGDGRMKDWQGGGPGA